MLKTMHVLRSKIVNAPKRKHDEYSSFSKRESPIALYINTVPLGVLKQERAKALFVLKT